MIGLAGFSVLRLVLFLALVARRVNLEILKRRQTRPETRLKRVTFAKVAKGGVQLFLAVQTLFLVVLPITQDPAGVQTAGCIVFFLGILTTIVSRRQLGKSWVDLEEAQILPDHELVTHGLYSCIRHPIYTADLLLFIGLQLALNSWLVLGAVALVPILHWRTKREEVHLEEAFPGYAEYRTRTKRFIPFVL